MADDLRRAGFTLYEMPSPRSPVRYLRAYRSLLRRAGPFDAVHSHLNFPGLLMLAARQEGVPVRIAQSHVSPALMTKGLISGGYARLTNRLFLRHMTIGIAVSQDAALTFFDRDWQLDPRIRLEPCGIDLAPFQSPPRDDLRTRLGIPEGDMVMAQIGRFSAEKNQSFGLEVLAQLRQIHPDAHLLLVGDGPARVELAAQARRLEVEDRVLFLGERRDVPALLRNVIDLMLLPSLTEGSPLTVLEAQAAGAPCLVSTAVPRQSLLDGDRIGVMELHRGAAAWAAAAVRLAEIGHSTEHDRKLRSSAFDIRHNAALLEACYRGESPSPRA
jgi:glycosyltransferase involved in cell wall biosynthesis